MLRLAFSALLLSACLGGTKALAQQKTAPASATPPAQAAPQTAPAATQPTPATTQPAPAADTPPTSWIAAAAYVDEAEADPVSRSGGQQVAPGFTSAPTHRVTTDYQGRPLKPFVRVRRSTPAAETPAPAPTAPATNTMGNQAAPTTPAPAKPTQSGSDW